MAEIVLTNVTKRWGQFYAVENLNLTIGDNSFVTLLGPSGCGKTTTLRMIAGLETPTSGRITIDGVPVFDSELGINVSANKRKVGFLFQNYALWPNMTVYQNIAFGLSNVREEMPEVDLEARCVARMLEILRERSGIERAVAESSGHDGKPAQDKAVLRLIDMFDISAYTARELMGCVAGKDGNIGETALQAADRLKVKLAEIDRKRQASGRQVNERFEFIVNGQAVTSERKLSREEIDLAIRRVSRIVKIGMFMDRYPSELSGGQQQRVAIARTLAPGPKVLFMDEPLSNLDAKLRLEMRSELQRLHLETGSTFVYVTHDQMEAMTLATRICLMDNGVLQQYDEPLTVYNRPSNLFVADFVGSPAINFIEVSGVQASDGSLGCTLLGGRRGMFTPEGQIDITLWHKEAAEREQVKLDEQAAARRDKRKIEKSNKDTLFRYRIMMADERNAQQPAMKPVDDEYVIGIRPEFVSIGNDGPVLGEVFSAMPTGMETTLRIRVDDFLLTAVVFGGVTFKLGQKVRFGFRGNSAILFNRKNGQMLTIGSLLMEQERSG